MEVDKEQRLEEHAIKTRIIRKIRTYLLGFLIIFHIIYELSKLKLIRPVSVNTLLSAAIR